MMGIIDLHTHSSYSDGELSPKELVLYAKKKGLTAIALTDHDTINGVEEAVIAGEEANIEVIRGVEISTCVNNADVHILGYFFSKPEKELSDFLEEIRITNNERCMKICENLEKNGYKIYYDEIINNTKTCSSGRGNIARLMYEKGYVKNPKEAFEKYIGRNCPFYVEKKYISPNQAVNVIKENKGKAFVAHLNQIKLPEEEALSLVLKLKKEGLDGIEGYHSGYDENDIEKYINFAKEQSLKVCGGSDYHGKLKPGLELGTGYGNLKIAYEILEGIKR